MRLITASAILAALSFMAGCGGGGSSSSSSTTPPGGTGGGSSNPGGAVVTPTPVAPAAGGTVTGVDINVPAVTPVLNTRVLGVTAPGTGGSAQATGAIIHRGTAMRVLLFGTGLSGSQTVGITGPSDISVTQVQSITSTTGVPGISFLATVDANAALGARTVVIRDSNDNISTFTGGLEVMP